ncbi:glucans biosynthesis glucosyltransferase MdoH [Filomicrobium sp.]|uniref:glucans biosynthesis glucosyltransferase MdoH n=1 Tax=Filomicrobium sp. TaxID=2024831 RepID=UPI0025830242|nr:glucans biosynthesis glucosyltransferase MdoH [Filomicrobium sp.]MCV0370342.1 glucans biosynthesis glucosyltransferase MdoH [Filomicrobium sp.]
MQYTSEDVQVLRERLSARDTRSNPRWWTVPARRLSMVGLNIATLAALFAGVATVLGGDGWTLVDVLIMACVVLSAPWTVLASWNAIIGLFLTLAYRDPAKIVAPFWSDASPRAPIKSRCALLMTVRNEDPDRAFARLEAIRASLEQTGQSAAFDLFVLSDTDIPAIAEREEQLFADKRRQFAGLGNAYYRRRSARTGFKAGNVWEFVETRGSNYDLMIPLDADSLMSGSTIVRMVTTMERHPEIGILQSLVVGAPTESGFARIFQFGMRQGMRAFTLGSAWWQQDCGPFWGHNAVIRVEAFARHCDLPVLPGRAPLGGHLLSHDQVEAVLMRRGGYEVRVIPEETESWEENPVTILDYMQRDQRWCNGNMQYWRLLGMPGLATVSRFQIAQAIAMYIAPVAWMLMMTLAAVKAATETMETFDPTLAVGLYVSMFILSLMPKIVGAIQIALEPNGVARLGGPMRFAAGLLVEFLFSLLMAPVVAFRVSIFMVGLLFGARISWGGQTRDAYRLSWAEAARAMWPQTLFGAVLTAVFAHYAPQALPWAAPVLCGLLLAIPFAVLTSSPQFGTWMRRHGIARTPEEAQTTTTYVSGYAPLAG